MKLDAADPFNRPVDPVELGIPVSICFYFFLQICDSVVHCCILYSYSDLG